MIRYPYYNESFSHTNNISVIDLYISQDKRHGNSDKHFPTSKPIFSLTLYMCCTSVRSFRFLVSLCHCMKDTFCFLVWLLPSMIIALRMNDIYHRGPQHGDISPYAFLLILHC